MIWSDAQRVGKTPGERSSPDSSASSAASGRTSRTARSFSARFVGASTPPCAECAVRSCELQDERSLDAAFDERFHYRLALSILGKCGNCECARKILHAATGLSTLPQVVWTVRQQGLSCNRRVRTGERGSVLMVSKCGSSVTVSLKACALSLSDTVTTMQYA